jgi:hypothetical protein
MLVNDKRITMSESEWRDFQGRCNPPWKPRTPEEFNAMCDLASARLRADEDSFENSLFADAIQSIKFGANGEVNFPEDQRKLDFVKVHGTWPSEEELTAWLGASKERVPLAVVR